MGKRSNLIRTSGFVTKVYAFVILVVSLLLSATSFAQTPTISYLLPDIGSPGINTYIEIVGPTSTTGNFGANGLFLNNSHDSLRVLCANPSDTQYLRFGPLVVSWDGRLISTEVFVYPWVTALSSNWQQGIAIPIEVIYHGHVSNLDTFYIVRPQSVGNNGEFDVTGNLGSGGMWGQRSRRGAMIVDSLFFNTAGAFGVDVSDCDPATPGNQGYFPAVIISKGPVRFIKSSSIAVDATGINGGPGGGGGGGDFDEVDPEANEVAGGDGYTGGMGSHINGGAGTGESGHFDGTGGKSLNGVVGAFDLSKTSGAEGSGGGTGSCFGVSGTGGFSTVGGYGGGSGSLQDTTIFTGFGGGGGGFATAGTTSGKSGAGQIYGNKEMVPLAGGSGGAGGNPFWSQPGIGGGGGGCLAFFSQMSMSLQSLSSLGADGLSDTQSYHNPPGNSGSGGAGSGGAIVAGAKGTLSASDIDVRGGKGGISKNPYSDKLVAKFQNGGDGGDGRVRLDASISGTAPLVHTSGTNFIGISTGVFDTVTRTFTLTGSGNQNQIQIFIGTISGNWQLAKAIPGIRNWSTQITLSGNDSVYFLVAMQQVPSAQAGAYTAEPTWVMSQASANILFVKCTGAHFITDKPTLDFGTVSACQQVIDTILLTNVGCDTATTSVAIKDASYGLTLKSSSKSLVNAGTTDTILIGLQPTSSGPFTTEVDISSPNGTIPVQITGIGANNGPSLDATPQSVNLGSVSPCATIFDTLLIANNGCDSAIVTDSSGSPSSGITIVRHVKGNLQKQEADTLILKVHITTPGPVIANVRLNDQTGGLTIPITGTVTNTADQYSFSPSAIDFGTISLCARPTEKLVIQNTGCDTISLTTSLDSSGTGLSIRSGSQLTIPPDSSDTVVVALIPQTAGTLYSTFRIHGPRGDSVISINAVIGSNGTAVQINVDPVAQTLLCHNNPVTIHLTNVFCDSITVTGYTLGGTNASDFSLTTKTPIGIGVNGSVTLTGTFDPTDSGTRTATFTFHIMRADGSTIDTTITVSAGCTEPVYHVRTLGNYSCLAGLSVNIPLIADESSLANIEGMTIALNMNTDLLAAQSAIITGGVFAGSQCVVTPSTPNQLTITASSAVAFSAGDTLCMLPFQAYVSSKLSTDIRIASVGFQEQAGNSNCIAGAVDTSSFAHFDLITACGDSLISQVMAGKNILSLLRIVPNPTPSDATIVLAVAPEYSGDGKLEIFNEAGVLLSSRSLTFNRYSSTQQIAVHFSESGIHYVRVVSPSGATTYQVVVEK